VQDSFITVLRAAVEDNTLEELSLEGGTGYVVKGLVEAVPTKRIVRPKARRAQQQSLGPQN